MDVIGLPEALLLASDWSAAAWAGERPERLSSLRPGVESGRLSPPARARIALGGASNVPRSRPSVRKWPGVDCSETELAALLACLTPQGGEMPYRSAGALYPIHIFTCTRQNGSRSLGYLNPAERALILTVSRPELSRAEIFEPWAIEAPLLVIAVADFSRVGSKYGRRGARFALVEAGSMMQLLEQQAESEGYVGCRLGGYGDLALLEYLGLSAGRFGIADVIALGRGEHV